LQSRDKRYTRTFVRRLVNALDLMDKYFGSMAGACEEEAEAAIAEARAVLRDWEVYRPDATRTNRVSKASNH